MHTFKMITSSSPHDSINPDALLKSHSQVRAMLSLSAFLKVCPGKQFSTVTVMFITDIYKLMILSMSLN